MVFPSQLDPPLYFLSNLRKHFCFITTSFVDNVSRFISTMHISLHLSHFYILISFHCAIPLQFNLLKTILRCVFQVLQTWPSLTVNSPLCLNKNRKGYLSQTCSSTLPSPPRFRCVFKRVGVFDYNLQHSLPSLSFILCYFCINSRLVIAKLIVQEVRFLKYQSHMLLFLLIFRARRRSLCFSSPLFLPSSCALYSNFS